MLVLGWHGGLRPMRSTKPSLGHSMHDAAAVLLRDGSIIAAIEEERLNRVKHSNFFPAMAIRFCLREAGVAISDLDAIATDWAEDMLDFWAIRECLGDPRLPLMTGRQWVNNLFQEEFNADISTKLHFCGHHLAHLYSAWYPSGFPSALGVSIDGDGDGLSGLVASCEDQQIKVLRRYTIPQSLGHFYLSLIHFIGYERFDEYKVMGLAPYGNPAVYDALFRKMYRLLPEGQFEIASDEEKFVCMSEAGLIMKARRKGELFTQQHKDFSAALQVSLERIVQHVIRHFQKITGATRLCLAGGVAHNCTMNGQVLRSRLFDRIFIQPAAHDAGNALGAALSVDNSGSCFKDNPMRHVYFGTDIGSSDEIATRLADWGPLLEAKRVRNAAREAAELLAQGAVIGWVQGRSEFGPRALGNRSILADPRPAENKSIINAMVKKRESYRPFAPSVLEERVADFFELPSGCDSLPFMIMTLIVRPEVQALLGAVTHVDGSARVQSVSRRDSSRYYELIEEFGRLTGVPIVLNTSFNNNAEPIVDSIDDAVTCFCTTGIHYLVIDDFVVSKVASPETHPAFLDMAPSLPSSRKLVRMPLNEEKFMFALESLANSALNEQQVQISSALFRVLLLDAGKSSLRTRCRVLEIENPIELSRLASEVFDLWQRRVLFLTPALERPSVHLDKDDLVGLSLAKTS